MNKTQKIILAIFVPVLLFFVALTIAYYASVDYIEYSTIYKIHNPFNWGKTWYIWFLSLISIILFEYKLFEDKKKKYK